MLTRHIAASIFSLAICAMPLAAACDADDANLAAEVDRLQAENDALRAAARLSVVAPIYAPPPPIPRHAALEVFALSERELSQ